MKKDCKGSVKQFFGFMRKWAYKSFMRLVMVSYVCFAIVLIIVLFFVLLSLYLTLKDKTSAEIRDTLSRQADDNMLALSVQGSAALWEHLAQVQESMRLVGEVMVSMQNETTFALKNRESYTLDQACSAQLCKKVFAYKEHSNQYSREWVNKTSRLEPVVKLMVDSGLFPLGIAVHYVDWGFSRFMPPSIAKNSFVLTQEPWYNEWVNRPSVNGEKVASLISEVDMSTENYTATLMRDLKFNGRSIGVITVKLSAQEMFRYGFSDVTYMNKSIVLTVHRSGSVLNQNLQPRTIESLGLGDAWGSIKSDPYKFSNVTHKLVFQGEKYRYATYPLGDTLSSSSLNWWFVTALAIREADILDLDINNNYETDMALWMLVYPILAAVFVLCLGGLLVWMLNNKQLRTPMNRITEAMECMKKGNRKRAGEILMELGRKLHKSEVQRLVLGMHRLIREVGENRQPVSQDTQ